MSAVHNSLQELGDVSVLFSSFMQPQQHQGSYMFVMWLMEPHAILRSAMRALLSSLATAHSPQQQSVQSIAQSCPYSAAL
jgi:hypothetical protein